MDNQTEHYHGDKYLVEKVLLGDQKAFGTVIRNTQALVAQIVYKMIANSEDRKDLAQDIYLKAFDKLPGFRFQSKLSTWIAQIAYNTCLSYLDKKKLVFPGKLADDQTSEEALDNISIRSMDLRANEIEKKLSHKQVSRILETEIDALPVIYKTLLVLYHQEDMSYDDMSQITGLPEGTVKSYLFRARKALRDNLLLKFKLEDL